MLQYTGLTWAVAVAHGKLRLGFFGVFGRFLLNEDYQRTEENYLRSEILALVSSWQLTHACYLSLSESRGLTWYVHSTCTRDMYTLFITWVINFTEPAFNGKSCRGQTRTYSCESCPAANRRRNQWCATKELRRYTLAKPSHCHTNSQPMWETTSFGSLLIHPALKRPGENQLVELPVACCDYTILSFNDGATWSDLDSAVTAAAAAACSGINGKLVVYREFLE